MYLEDYQLQISNGYWPARPFLSKSDMSNRSVGLGRATISRGNVVYLFIDYGRVTGYNKYGQYLFDKKYVGRNYDIPIRKIITQHLKEIGVQPDFLCT